MRFITLDSNNKVISVRIGPSITDGEIESETGELGQIMQEGGSFIDDPTPPPAPEESQMDRIESTLDLLLLKQEGIL